MNLIILSENGTIKALDPIEQGEYTVFNIDEKHLCLGIVVNSSIYTHRSFTPIEVFATVNQNNLGVLMSQLNFAGRTLLILIDELINVSNDLAPVENPPYNDPNYNYNAPDASVFTFYTAPEFEPGIPDSGNKSMHFTSLENPTLGQNYFDETTFNNVSNFFDNDVYYLYSSDAGHAPHTHTLTFLGGEIATITPV